MWQDLALGQFPFVQLIDPADISAFRFDLPDPDQDGINNLEFLAISSTKALEFIFSLTEKANFISALSCDLLYLNALSNKLRNARQNFVLSTLTLLSTPIVIIPLYV